MLHRNINERNCVHAFRLISAMLSSANGIYCYFLHILIYNHLLEYFYGVFVENELFKKIENLIIIVYGKV